MRARSKSRKLNWSLSRVSEIYKCSQIQRQKGGASATRSDYAGLVLHAS